MGNFMGMLGGIWQSFIDFVTGMFALIPQFIYFIYTCCASILDLMQFVVRKLVGLDVYYVNGEATSGDIVYNFISGILGINGKNPNYSVFSTVFWSLVIFGIIVLILSTIISIIKNQYTYDAKKSNPMNIVFSSIKTFFLMAIIPVTCIFGVYLSNVLLRAVDDITSPASSSQIEEVYKNSSVNYTMYFEKGKTSQGIETYSSYDFFGSRAYTNSPTFSGIMFKIVARNANRVRYGSYTASTASTTGDNFLWSDFGVFTSESPNPDIRQDEVADMIDFAFANCLTLTNKDANASLLGKESFPLVSSFMYFESAVWYLGLHNVECFSKYNVGLVWYYYNLWAFNFFLAYAGIIACITLFSSVFFGLIVRLIQLLALFLVYPTLVGIGPLDNNSAIGKWQKEFVKNILMGYGAIVGLNLSFMLLNEFQKIYFFKSDILNYIMDMIILLVILAVIGDVIKFFSKIVGGEDANSVGADTKKEIKKVGMAGVNATIKAAEVALKVGALVVPQLKVADKAMSMAKTKANKEAVKQAQALQKQQMANQKGGNLDYEKMMEYENAELEKDVKEFSDVLDQNKGDENSKESIDRIRDINKKSREKLARPIYNKFRRRLSNGLAMIDQDESLSSAEREARKEQFYDRIKNEAIEEFSNHNYHSIMIGAIKSLLDSGMIKNGRPAFGVNDNSDAGEKIVEGDSKASSSNEGTGASAKRPRAYRSPLTKSVLDISDQTFKVIGEITGLSSAWKSLDKDTSVVDSLKSFAQTFFQKANVTSEVRRIEDGTSSFLTKKQKDKIAKADKGAYRKSLDQMKNNSEKMRQETLNMVKAIEDYLRRNGRIN